MLIGCASMTRNKDILYNTDTYSYRTIGHAKVEHCQRIEEEEDKTTKYDCVLVKTEGISGEFSGLAGAIMKILWPF